MKYYLIAGEKSGDMHGANLIRALNKQDPHAYFRIWGGEEMQKAGGELVMHYSKIAIMGIPEAVKKLWQFRGYYNQCKKDIITFDPDVLILIDFAGFNVRIAEFAKKKGFRVFYYISPKVWAWNTSRAWKIKKYVDRMFVILPFEKAFYKKFDWDVDYVGNPVAEAVSKYQVSVDFSLTNPGLNKPYIAILPGSRKQEVIKMLPVMLEVIRNLPDYTFLIAGVSALSSEIYDMAMPNLPSNAQLYIDQTYEILSVSRSAIVTSGTATLETALWQVPQVVGYKTGGITYAVGAFLVKIKYFSLVNLIADEDVVIELLQKDCNVTSLTSEIRLLTENDNHRNEVLAGYQKVREILGNESASEKTAKLMMGYLKEH